MTKYLALDIGNVLCHLDLETFPKTLSETFNISLEEAGAFCRGFQSLHDLGCTNMEKELRTYFKINSEVTLNRIIQTWNDMVYPCKKSIDTIDVILKNYDVKVALLSNIGVEHAKLAPEKLAPIYDKCIKHFSCFVGARKPTMLYYQSFLLQYPEFKGCLYVDDLLENLEASKQFGFKTLHFNCSDDEANPEDIWNNLFIFTK